MAQLSRRATVYFDPAIHKALRMKAAQTQQSISELVDEALRTTMTEDAEDLEAFEVRSGDRLVGYEEMVKKLKADGRL